MGLETLLAQQRDGLVREETVVATTVGDDRPVAEIWKLVWRLRHTMLAANVKAHGPPPPLTEQRPDLDTSRAPYCSIGAEEGIRTLDPLLGNWGPALQAATDPTTPIRSMQAASN